MKARNEAGEIEPRDRAVRQQSVQDEIDGRRDQDAERAARSNGAEKERLVVFALLDLGKRHRADRCRRGDAGARGRREHGARADVGVHEAARQPRQPLGDGVVDPLGDARAQQDLAQHHEQGDGDQDVLARRVPDDLTHRPMQRHHRVELVEGQPQNSHDRRNGNAERKQDDQQQQRRRDHP